MTEHALIMCWEPRKHSTLDKGHSPQKCLGSSRPLTMRELCVLQRREEKAAAFLGGGVRQNVSGLGFE